MKSMPAIATKIVCVRKRVWSLAAVVCMLISTSAFAQKSEAPTEVTIGVTPTVNPELMKDQSLELAKTLQTEFNTPFNIYVSKDYMSLVEAMKNKKIDFGFYTAMSFVAAEEKAHAKVLLKKVWNEPFYFSAILVKENSKIKKIEQLKGKKVAFVDTQSTSGYLYPLVEFRKRGLSIQDFGQVKYSGNHSASVKLLDNDEVDAIATFSDDKNGKLGAWIKFGAKTASKAKYKYRVLWVSEPIPTDTFCVRLDFYEKYPKFTHTLMFSLIDIFEKNKVSGRFSEILGLKDLMPATSRQYDPVREMVKTLGVVSP